MNDKQTTALLLLIGTAFIFWLYNTDRLQTVIRAITAIPNTGGADFGQKGYNEYGPGFDETPKAGTLPPLAPSGNSQNIPLIDQFGNPIKDNNGNPIIYHRTSENNTGLETSGTNTLNKIADYTTPILGFFQLPTMSLPTGLGGYA